MFKTKNSNNKKSEDVKKSAGKVLDTKKDTPTRAKVIWLNFFLLTLLGTISLESLGLEDMSDFMDPFYRDAFNIFKHENLFEWS